MKTSELLQDAALHRPQVFFYQRKTSEERNIVDAYLDMTDRLRWLGYYDYLMFVLLVAEDIADVKPSANQLSAMRK